MTFQVYDGKTYKPLGYVNSRKPPWTPPTAGMRELNPAYKSLVGTKGYPRYLMTLHFLWWKLVIPVKMHANKLGY